MSIWISLIKNFKTVSSKRSNGGFRPNISNVTMYLNIHFFICEKDKRNIYLFMHSMRNILLIFIFCHLHQTCKQTGKESVLIGSEEKKNIYLKKILFAYIIVIFDLWEPKQWGSKANINQTQGIPGTFCPLDVSPVIRNICCHNEFLFSAKYTSLRNAVL